MVAVAPAAIPEVVGLDPAAAAAGGAAAGVEDFFGGGERLRGAMADSRASWEAVLLPRLRRALSCTLTAPTMEPTRLPMQRVYSSDWSG